MLDFFSGRAGDLIGTTQGRPAHDQWAKSRTTQANSSPAPAIWDTISDRTFGNQFHRGVARGHAAAGSSLMGICGRPAHDHWMNSPSSGQHTATISPVMIARFRRVGRCAFFLKTLPHR